MGIIYDVENGETIEPYTIPECSELCKDALRSGTEVFIEMQVSYQENFRARMFCYDHKIEHPGDVMDAKRACGKIGGGVPLSHIGAGLCAWDCKHVNKKVSDDQRELARKDERFSGSLDIDPSMGHGLALSTVFLGDLVIRSHKDETNGFEVRVNDEPTASH
ncbi:MAG: hypothetical protein LBD34_02425 [Puniceicoccales bacterium]|jgi:hypothetical protein|nr:hypothetical protein [Puniceicoccales bacterium]